MLIEPNDKVIVVTGGSRGIGAAIVTHLAYLGYTVYGTYNSNPEQAQLIATHLSNEGAQVHFIQMNVASEESVRLGFEHIVKKKVESTD